MASSLSTRLSREDYKKAKELEELRKTGAAPPELDEDGKMINPHIPQYVSQAPWYLNNNRPGLKHQRTSAFAAKEDIVKINNYYQRGKQAKPKARGKWKKGACENCGAMTHKTIECVERPRRKGAKLTNTNIAADEKVHGRLNMDFDGKRDRWNGYNPAQYKQVIDHFDRTEAERRKEKKKELDAKFMMKKELKEKRRKEREKRREEKRKKKAAEKAELKAKKKAEGKEAMVNDGLSDSDSDTSDTDTDTDTDTDNEEEDDDELLDEDLDTEGRNIMKKSDNAKMTTNRTTARNLRIREDTAKYLRNLNVHSAHYDPKTRSMRENPYPDKDPSELLYAGDNFSRKSGDTQEIAKLQLFVWDAAQKNQTNDTDIHVLANPSQAELMFEQFREKKEALKGTRSRQMVAKYGGEEHFEAPPKELLMAQSESYVEYSETGEVVKGQEAAVPKTKYVEDVHESNHSAVWGSFYVKGKWGYSCCHSTLRSSYCTGAAGKKAEKQGDKPKVPLFLGAPDSDKPSKEQSAFSKAAKKRRQEQEEEEARAAKKSKNSKGYNSGFNDGATPTDEDMNAYYKARSDTFNDPLKNMKDTI